MNKAFVKKDDAWEAPEAPVAPLTSALLDGRQGDLVKVRTPAGEEALEILALHYPQ